MTNYVLELVKITKSFPGVQVLKGIDFALREGEIHSLLGENGAGKSTLVNLIAGVYAADSGEIQVQGEAVSFKTPHDSLHSGISIIHQELSLVPDLSVAENIFLGRLPDGWVNWRKLNRLAAEVVERIGLAVDPGVPVRFLSTGQQQQVEIARALALNPRILIMDEPTSALTEHEVKTLFGVIRKLAAEGLAVLYISHHMDEIWEISNTITVLRDGLAIFTKPVEQCTAHDIAEAMLGHELVVDRNRRKVVGERVLEVEGLTSKGKFEDIRIRVAKGEIVGIAGQLGAGKTELLRAIYGSEPPETGEVFFEGKKMTSPSPRASIDRGICMIPENRKSDGLVLGMNVGENMTFPLLDKISPSGFLSKKKQQEIVNEYIGKMNIKTTGMNKMVSELSGGNQQKVILSRWISMNPKLFLLDQPTRGIDIGSKEEIYQLMRRLTETGAAILFVATEVPELLRTCDRIYVMRDGKMVKEFQAESCTEKDIVMASMGGMVHA